MADTFISYDVAMRILQRDGDFTAEQARIVLLHSRKQAIEGADYFPRKYIYQRAKQNAARPD